jgi:hypothetical protein
MDVVDVLDVGVLALQHNALGLRQQEDVVLGMFGGLVRVHFKPIHGDSAVW